MCPRPPEVGWLGLGIHQDFDGFGSIMSADARGHTETPVGVHGNREGGPLRIGVLVRHERKTQRGGTWLRQRDADEAPAELGHEVHRLGRHEGSRTNQVSLVLAILVVGDDDDLALTDVLQGLFDGIERHGQMLLPATMVPVRRVSCCGDVRFATQTLYQQ